MPTATFHRQLDTSTSPEETWKALTDVPRVVSWVSIVQDATEHERLSRYGAVLADRLGPFRLRADLDIDVSDVRETRHLKVRAEGEDRQVASRISVDAELDLQPLDAGTRVTVSGTYEVAGRVATLGAGTIRKKADKILEEFFQSAEKELG